MAWALPEIEVVEAEQARTAQQLWLLQRVCSAEHGNGEKGVGGRIEGEGNGNIDMVRRVKAEEKLKLSDTWYQTGKALGGTKIFCSGWEM